MRPARFTVDPHILDNADLSKVEVLRAWQHQISVLLEQLQSGIIALPPTPTSSVYLDGNGNWSTPAGAGGGGDMYKATYDTNNNGVVDTCDSLAWTAVTGKPATFAPSAHASTHLSAGADPISLASATLAGLCPTVDNTTIQVVASKLSCVALSYSNLTGVPASFTPSAHASTHLDNGTDPIAVATTLRTGSAPKLSGSATTFLNGTGAYSTPTGVTPAAHASTHITGGSDVIPAPTTSATGLVPVLPASLATSKFLRGDATFTQPDWTNLTGVPASFTPAAHHATHVTGGSDVIATATSSVSGLVPVTPGAATQFLAGGATAAFAVPPSATATTAGYVPTPPNNTTQFLRGDATWATPSVGSPPSSLTDLGSPAGNSTINTGQAFLIAVNLVWTTAANWTLTLQNVALGSEFHLRFLNSSGATRTFTITATNPSAASYTIAVYVPGSNALTGALSINNGEAINLRGVSYTVGGNPTIQLFGFGSTG